jgi:two-component system, OmpR family, osmolarity sensor histidine kinase EnvZ
LVETHPANPEYTSPIALDEPLRKASRWSLARVSLFWRTFFLIALLLLGSIVAWLQTLRSFEFAPRAEQVAQQLATQVNLSRAALIHADGIARISLLKAMSDTEGLRIVPRERSDKFVVADNDTLIHDMVPSLRQRLGQKTVVASRVNAQNGLWISFDIDGDDYWLVTDSARFNLAGGTTWVIWLTVAAALSLAGAALIAGLINRPLKQLSFAATRVQEGDFSASQLSENVHTSEIREVNIGFNRMAQQLAKIEQDRAIMLAGISHDLRTPLARLRLETELSVADLDARAHMAADIVQLDAIIDKFLDYARPDTGVMTTVVLSDVVDSCVFAYNDKADVRLHVQLQHGLLVLADHVELGRVLSNLLENARRYGKSPDTGIAHIELAAIAKDRWILIKIRDRGTGVDPEQLANLTKPFYRGEAARTHANGAGLGLAIVQKTIQRMNGAFALTNSGSGGLSAHIKLPRAPHP